MKMQEIPTTFQCWGENFHLECNYYYNMDLVRHVQFSLWSSETLWGLLQLEVKQDPWSFFLCNKNKRKKSNYQHFYRSSTEILNSVGPNMNSWCTPLVTDFMSQMTSVWSWRSSSHLTAHLSKLHFCQFFCEVMSLVRCLTIPSHLLALCMFGNNFQD